MVVIQTLCIHSVARTCSDTGATCVAGKAHFSDTPDFTRFGEFMILPIHYNIYTLQNWSVLCIIDSGLFAWISVTIFSRTYFILIKLSIVTLFLIIHIHHNLKCVCIEIFC